MMSKIGCLCGHVIVDQTTNLPSKAQFFADGDYQASYEKFIAICDDFIRAREEGRQDACITSHFGEEYPKDLEIQDYISDKLAGMLAIFGHTLYECEQCGRLWVQPDAAKNWLVTSLPEGRREGCSKHGRYRTKAVSRHAKDILQMWHAYKSLNNSVSTGFQNDRRKGF